MGNKDLYITIPTFFKCPISLEVMKSPVILSTGVTYDRTTIQRWLDAGNTTCPATMQVLTSTDFVPNHNLHRLIQTWSSNNHNKHSTISLLHSFNNNNSVSSSSHVLNLISRVSSPGGPETRVEELDKILRFASESLENRKLVVLNECFVWKLAEILCTDERMNLQMGSCLEVVLKLFQIVTSMIDNKLKNVLLNINMNLNLIPSLSKILNTNNSGLRVVVISIIMDMASSKPEFKKLVFDTKGVLPQLLNILSNAFNGEEVEKVEISAVLSCLISLCTPRSNKIKLIEAGGVTIITKFIKLSYDDNNNRFWYTIMELLLTLLEMLVGCKEGRVAITDDPNCVPGIVARLMKFSRVAKEHAIALLWSLCCLFRDQKGREAMMKSNGGLTKILLLMQSDCSPAVKRMCCDLLRVFRVYSKSCLSSYDTKTTHIMPC